MRLAAAFGSSRAVERVRDDVDLFGDEVQQGRGRPFAGAQRAAGVVEVAEHQRVTETVVVATAAPDGGEIRSGESVVAHQLTLLGGRVEQRADLRLAQLLPSRHSMPPAP